MTFKAAWISQERALHTFILKDILKKCFEINIFVRKKKERKQAELAEGEI